MTNPRNGFRVLFLHHTADPDKRSPEWRANAERGMPKWAARREYDIDFESIAGFPCYPEFLNQPRFLQLSELTDGNVCRPFGIPASWHRYRAIDPGFVNPFACNWFAVSPARYANVPGSPKWTWGKPKPTIFGYREHYERGQRTPYHKERIHKLTGREEIVFTVIDPEAQVDKGYSVRQDPREGPVRHRTYQQELLEDPFSIPTIPFVRMKSEYLEIDTVATAIKERQLVFFATCVETIREHERWTFKERPNEQMHNAFEIPVDKDNHTCDTVKYFLNSPWDGSPGMEGVEETPAHEVRKKQFWAMVHRQIRERTMRQSETRDELGLYPEAYEEAGQ